MPKYKISFYSDFNTIVDVENEDVAMEELKEHFDGYSHDFIVELIDED